MMWVSDLPQFSDELVKVNSRKPFPFNLVGVDLSRIAEYYTATLFLGRYVDASDVTVLDIGTYLSPFPAWLASKGVNVIGIDIDPRLRVQRALRSGGEGRLEVMFADGLALPFRCGTIDLVVAISTIEHIPDDGDIRVLLECQRCLKPGGVIFMTVPVGRRYEEGTWGKWFQRVYTWDALVRRIGRAGGLQIIDYGFLFGGGLGIIYDFWYRIPAPVRHGLGWLHWWKLLDVAAPADKDSGRVCWLVLGKC